MASAITFDTHRFVTGLIDKKMPKEQAEFLADTYNNLLSDRIATKDDVRSTAEQLRTEMQAMESRIWAKVLGLHIATVGTSTAIILAALRFWV